MRFVRARPTDCVTWRIWSHPLGMRTSMTNTINIRTTARRPQVSPTRIGINTRDCDMCTAIFPARIMTIRTSESSRKKQGAEALPLHGIARDIWCKTLP